MKLNILVLIASLAIAGAAEARAPGGQGGQGGHGQSSPPSAPSAPAAAPGIPGDIDGSAGRTNYVFAEDGMKRRTMNPGFCTRNAGDYYVVAKLARCTGY